MEQLQSQQPFKQNTDKLKKKIVHMKSKVRVFGCFGLRFTLFFKSQNNKYDDISTRSQNLI